METLLFAPGMFDPTAEDYWSYVFLMDLKVEARNANELAALFELYFDGLLTSVAASKGTVIENPAHVAIQRVEPTSFEGRAQLVDAFGAMERIELHLVIEQSSESPEGTRLQVMASPQELDHAVWTALRGAKAALALRSPGD